jgi:hypothetical protein
MRRDAASAVLLCGDARPQRREVGEQVSRVHLEENHRFGQAAESPGAEAADAGAVRKRLDDLRANRGGRDDLAPCAAKQMRPAAWTDRPT